MKNVPFQFGNAFTAAALLAVSVCSPVFAQNISTATLTSVGQYKASPNTDYVPAWDFKIATPSVLLTDRNLRYGLKLRYQASPRLGVEASVDNLRAYNTATGIRDPFNIYASAALANAAAARGYGLDLVSTLPITDRLSIAGRVGLQTVRNDYNFNAYGLPRLFSQSRVGLGVQYSLTKSVGLRLELEHYYRLSGNTFSSPFSADNVSLGVQFKF